MLSWRNRHFFLLDLLVLPATAVLAFALRLDASGMERYRRAILIFTAVAVPVKLFVFYRLKLYARFWRHATVDELLLIATATGVSVLLTAAVLFALALPLTGVRGFPRSVPLIDGLLTPLSVGGPRFAVWLAWRYRRRRAHRSQRETERRVLLVGAGDAGTIVAREMRANPQFGLLPVGFVDDDEAKQGMRVLGLPVLGGRKRIPELVADHEIDQVVIAMPSAPGTAVREVLEICGRANVRARIVPGMYDILSGLVRVDQIREIQIEDLLRREPVEVDASAVERMLRGCRVLVTGAGGSIGGELCRQIARCEPAALVLVGHGENSVFAIANELRRRWPALLVEQVIADVRDSDRLRQAFERHGPHVVFHAAAHKHVPLMEANVPDAVTNNVLGTRNVLHLCEEHAVDRFVLISSDKVVRPTSVMGVTKRVAELLVYQAAKRCGRRYVSVRFGNVLGSRGSVIPLFQEQIARGGPVTVTHPDVRRFFMIIPEAVQLVLQAAALGQGGEVFILDMGEPIRIVDLATDLIRLSGLRPRVRWPDEDLEPAVTRHDWDVEVVFTGLRPGEKLFEELFAEGEEYAPTCHEKIFAAHANGNCVACPIDLDRAVDELIDEARHGDEDRIRAKLCEIVPRYTPVQRDDADRPPDRDRDVPRAEMQGQPSSSAPGHLKVGRRVAEV
jgi:FlaA1/EpsC-like NDP-sugar epimerase